MICYQPYRVTTSSVQSKAAAGLRHAAARLINTLLLGLSGRASLGVFFRGQVTNFHIRICFFSHMFLSRFGFGLLYHCLERRTVAARR